VPEQGQPFELEVPAQVLEIAHVLTGCHRCEVGDRTRVAAAPLIVEKQCPPPGQRSQIL
jgi:hypothetical protein